MTSWQRKKLITTYQMMELDLTPYLTMSLSRTDRCLLETIRRLLFKAKTTLVCGT